MPLTKTFCPYGSLMACEFLPQLKTPGGLVVPDRGGDDIPASAGEAQKAVVVAVGPEVLYYRPGDVVLVRAGNFLVHQGQKYAMIPEEETFGCANRDLESLSANERVKVLSDKKLREMIFEQASQIVAGIVRSAN